LPDLERLTIPIDHLQRKRNFMVAALRGIGYDMHVPEGTFYLLVRSPWSNDEAFTDLLAQHKIFCLPGTLVGLPGYVRVSLTASEAMIERAIPRFQAAWYQAQAFGERSRVLDHA
jgi:aspartate aminotransferase